MRTDASDARKPTALSGSFQLAMKSATTFLLAFSVAFPPAKLSPGRPDAATAPRQAATRSERRVRWPILSMIPPEKRATSAGLRVHLGAALERGPIHLAGGCERHLGEEDDVLGSLVAHALPGEGDQLGLSGGGRPGGQDDVGAHD